MAVLIWQSRMRTSICQLRGDGRDIDLSVPGGAPAHPSPSPPQRERRLSIFSNAAAFQMRVLAAGITITQSARQLPMPAGILQSPDQRPAVSMKTAADNVESVELTIIR